MKNEKNLGIKLAELVTANPWKVVLSSILISLFLASGASKIKMNSDYRYFFGEDNPQRLAFEKLQNVYAKDDSLLIVISPKDKKVFTKETLSIIKEITERSWKVPFSTRVDSVTNFQHTKGIDDDLIVEDLVLTTKDLTSANLEEKKTIALTEPIIKNRLINKDASVTAVNVTLTFPGKTQNEVPAVATFARNLKKEITAKYPNIEIRLSGMSMLSNAFNEAAMKDMGSLTPIMYGIILVVMAIMLKSILAVFATFNIIFFSVISGMGLAGFLGIPMTPPASIAPTVILTLAVADSIHILKSILYSMSLGHSKKDSIIEAMAANFRPVFLTSFTTVIGFLSLNFSDTPPFNDLGNITAMGVTMAFILSVTLLPALMTLLPIKRVKTISKTESKLLIRFGGWVADNKKSFLLTTLFTTIFFGMQIPKIQISDLFHEYFNKTIEFRNDTDYIMENLTGIYNINYDLSSGESGGISNPKYLKKVEEFSKWLGEQPHVIHVSTITDIFKRLNKNMHGDREEYYKLPDSRELSAQYLLLYEMSLPYGLDLNNQINVDKESTRVIATFENIETETAIVVNASVEKWLIDNAPEYMHTLGTSPSLMFSNITKRNVISMAWGTLLAFGLITITLIISLKSWKYGLISLLPNIIPAIIAFGVWSLTVGTAGFAIAIVSSVTIGIVVDDSVHFLSKYVRARREKGLNTKEAIEYAYATVGSALISTSVVLSLGFSVLMLSSFKMNVTLGALSALTIIAALIADFTFLPALLAVVDSDLKETTKTKEKGDNMKLKKTLATLTVAALAFTVGSTAKAQENKGLWVATQIEQADAGFINQVANIEMILKNKQGQSSTRQMKIKTLEVKGDGDKSLTIFNTPRDVKGTAFLSFSHTDGADDQWLFLPALKRVKRISSNNKSGPFMGSEFAYEDLSSQEVKKYTYKYIQKETSGHLIERYPVDKNSGYTKQIVLVNESNWTVQKVDFFDRKESLLKTLNYVDYKKYTNGKWRPAKMKMINHQNGKSTELVWSDYKFNQKISARDFNKNALKRLR
jgi:predicted RND superfamily exporter protein